MDAYKSRIVDVLRELKTKETGLLEEDVLQRLEQYGENISTKDTKTSLITIFFRQFKSVILYVLMAAAFVSFLVGDLKEFYIIFGIVLFIVLLSFFEEVKATRDMESLRNLTPLKTKVKRNGSVKEILSKELVPGDIIILRRGDIVPADGRIVSCSNLQIDESALTGESIPVSKESDVILDTVSLADRKNMVYTGGLVVNGSAECVVITTGLETEIGKIAQMVESAKEELSPLQKKLNTLGKKFGYVVVFVCFFIFTLGIIQRGGIGIEELLILSIAVAVAGIPESLPAVISVSLAIGMKRMAKKNAVVKRLSAVETLGTCTVICSDKTGTLTQNKMVVEHMWTFSQSVDVTGSGLSPKGDFLLNNKKTNPLSIKDIKQLLSIAVLCNDSELYQKEDSSYGVYGEATEGALLVLGEKAKLEKKSLFKKCPRLADQAFNSERKYMTAIHTVGKNKILFAKGAPEKILARSTHYSKDGVIKKLTPSKRKEILSKNHEFASQGYRVLSFAYKEYSNKKISKEYDENKLIFVGLVSIRDPPEPSAIAAIKECHEAGISVIMITGDNPLTASAIAKEMGILTPAKIVVSGDELEAMDDHKLHQIINSVAVFARVTPKHKLRVVKTLQDRGEIVAMTGDGVNDAPALKKADIGIAMGREGTEVARDASEMVLKDDNFATIVSAIEEGRNIYNNILRSLYYLLPGNFSQITIILIATIAGVLPPLTPLMILFVNLVTSDFPALGLTVEKSDKSIMKQKPRDPKENILSGYLILKIGQVVPIIVLGVIGLYLWEILTNDASYQIAQTMAFVTVIMFMLFHGLNAKCIDTSVFSKKVFTNLFFYSGFILSFIATLAVVYLPVMQSVFGTVALSFEHWIPILIISPLVVIYTEIQKTIIASEIEESKRLSLNLKRPL